MEAGAARVAGVHVYVACSTAIVNSVLCRDRERALHQHHLGRVRYVKEMLVYTQERCTDMCKICGLKRGYLV